MFSPFAMAATEYELLRALTRWSLFFWIATGRGALTKSAAENSLTLISLDSFEAVEARYTCTLLVETAPSALSPADSQPLGNPPAFLC